MRWLTLLTSLPPTPTRHRVGVWRKLQRMGAVRLRGSAWILPENPETTELFQWLVQEIQSFRGEATLLHVDRIGTMTDKQVTALFHRARAVEYQGLVQGCRDILAKLDRYRANHRGSIAQLRAASWRVSSASWTGSSRSTISRRRPVSGPGRSGRRRPSASAPGRTDRMVAAAVSGRRCPRAAAPG